MLLVPTRLSASSIHGVGVFVTVDVPEGEPVWRFEPAYDRVIPLAEAALLPQAFQDYLATYAYLSPEFPDAYVLSCDHAKFLNHSERPNTALDGRITRASRTIAAGEEMTCDYRLVVLGWTGFGVGSGE